LRKRNNMEAARADAVSLETVAIHFACIVALYEVHKIHSGRFVFNLDESGLSLRGMALGGRAKAVSVKGGHGNARELKFRGSIDHITFMPVVSAAGQSLRPEVVLPGKHARWRKVNGVVETVNKYLSAGAHYTSGRLLASTWRFFWTGLASSLRKRFLFGKSVKCC
jgi:hypothetical protein